MVIRSRLKWAAIIGSILILALMLVGPFLVPVPPLEGTRPVDQLAGPEGRFEEVNGLQVHYRLGAGRGLTSFLYVTVGTGVSASLVIDGVPYVGARGLTGTLASSRGLIPGDDGSLLTWPPLEQYAAGPAIAGSASSYR